MTIEMLDPLPPEEFRRQLESRGWTAKLLGMRWGVSARRVQQIIADADRPRYYDDAINNLPKVSRDGEYIK